MNTQSSIFLNSLFPHTDKRAARPALLCFSHSRWEFVHRRSHHLMTEAADDHRVFFIEEPECAAGPTHYRRRTVAAGITVLTPVFDAACDPVREQRRLVEELQAQLGGSKVVHWYDTPTALRFTRDLACDLCVYDRTEEMPETPFTAPDLVALEGELLSRAQLVFTGAKDQFDTKRPVHADTHCFPDSVDWAHFARARQRLADPADQMWIPGPRIGFAGVIDECIDLGLIATAARALPQIHFVMLGPLARVSPDDLPKAPNIHWLGPKTHDELPGYLSNWQSAWMPFAIPENPRAISRTKPLEFLAAGLRVTTTAVPDLVDTYGKTGLVSIADTRTMVPLLKTSLGVPPEGWRQAVEQHLAVRSWARTWDAMQTLMQAQMVVEHQI